MAEFTYGFNIKRDKRVAQNPQTANDERYIARLKNFGEKNNIETRIFALFASLKNKDGDVKITDSLSQPDMITAQKTLRDMYGILHYFIIGSKNLERVNTIGKFLKTFNKNIKVYFAVREGEDVNGVLDLNAVDSVITVSDGELKKAQSSILTTEKLSVSDPDAAVLYATAKIAKKAKNKRRNALAFLSDESEVNDEPEIDDAPITPEETATDSDEKPADETSAETPAKQNQAKAVTEATEPTDSEQTSEPTEPDAIG